MTDKYAVIGNPIAHSKSPLIHRLFAEQTGQHISYEAVLAPLDGFPATVERLRKDGYKGCNVTVPFKFEAYKLTSRLTAHADMARAVNTLTFDGGTVLGDNTDGTGLIRDIQNNLHVSLHNRSVLLVGAGGAASGVIFPLLHVGARLAIVNRTAEKARELAAIASRFSDSVSGYGFDDIADLQFDVVINATAASLNDSFLPLPSGAMESAILAYDMMYGRDTLFMKFARERGAATVTDGLGMLVEQAAESFFIWRGVRPDTLPVIADLRKPQ